MNQYQIKHSKGLALWPLTMVTVYFAITNPRFMEWPLGYIQLAFYIYLWLHFIAGVFLLFRKPGYLTYGTDTLYTGRREIRADEIERVMINGYFFPWIGVLPKGKRIVPHSLHFRFTKQEEDEAIIALHAWAKRNGLEVQQRSYRTWL